MLRWLVIALQETRSIPHGLSFQPKISEKRKVTDKGLLSFVRCRVRSHTILYLLALEAASY